jgi:hypothetical protein
VAAPLPAIVLVSEGHADEMLAGFARYEREYDLRVTPLAAGSARDHA